MLVWWLVQIAAGAVMVALFRYQRWGVRRSNRLARIKLDEGFGLTPIKRSSIRRPRSRNPMQNING